MKCDLVTSISLEMENLETVTIPYEDIEYLNVMRVNQCMWKYEKNKIAYNNMAEEIMIVFNKNAENTFTSSFDGFDTKHPYPLSYYLENDGVVGLTVRYSNGDEREFGVEWEEGENETMNPLQSSGIQNNPNFGGYGGYYLHIGRKNSFPEVMSMYNSVPDEKSVSDKEISYLTDVFGKEFSFTHEGNRTIMKTPFEDVEGKPIRIHMTKFLDDTIEIEDSGNTFVLYNNHNLFKSMPNDRYYHFLKDNGISGGISFSCFKENNMDAVVKGILGVLEVQILYNGYLKNLLATKE